MTVKELKTNNMSAITAAMVSVGPKGIGKKFGKKFGKGGKVAPHGDEAHNKPAEAATKPADAAGDAPMQAEAEAATKEEATPAPFKMKGFSSFGNEK